MSPKICEKCGEQAHSIDSRQHDEHVLRRYACPKCGERWSTAEIRLPDGMPSKELTAALCKKYSMLDRENIADQLIEMAQSLLR